MRKILKVSINLPILTKLSLKYTCKGKCFLYVYICKYLDLHGQILGIETIVSEEEKDSLFFKLIYSLIVMMIGAHGMQMKSSIKVLSLMS